MRSDLSQMGEVKKSLLGLALARNRSFAKPPRRVLYQAAGLMFWLTRNRLALSYLPFTAANLA